MDSLARIGLLDVDGVCLKPGGYRAAYRAAVAHFMGTPDPTAQAPLEKVPALFEARGITNEWDMIGLTLALAYNAWEMDMPGALDGKQLSDLTTDGVGLNGLDDVNVNYADGILMIGDHLREGVAPSHAVLEAVRSGQAGQLMANIPDPLLADLLGKPRDVVHTLTTQVFQNLVLGHERFRDTYGFSAGIETESYLNLHDRSNLNLETVEMIHRKTHAGEVSFCIYTARPSLAPKTVNVSSINYSPEAEMAVELVGLKFLPMIAFGRLQYAADLMELNLDELVKPSPVQALAAIAAAWLKDEVAALKWAVRFWQSTKSGRQTFLTELPAQLEIHVFEDSPTGVYAVRKAVEMLEQAGIKIQLKSWGISTNAEKIAALEQEGAKVFKDINQALQVGLAVNMQYNCDLKC
jgi:hypothetical protein